MYEHEFVDKIFMQHESFIKREDFISAISGDYDDIAKCNWLFMPHELRKVFQGYVKIENFT